ncbi:MAG TPA: glycosyltransferase family 1 protein [Ignavibacteria bacterium]|nr:glycosyltransferase family 1 protein [Ignavibacteria bacterium]
MKILYSCLSKSWGGMEMFTLTAVKQLHERNINVELLCIAESRIHMEANNIGVIIHPLKSSGYLNPFSVLKLALIIQKRKFDLIHTHASKDLWMLVPALKIIKNSIPLILTKHVGSYIVKKDKLHKWLYNRVTFALAISNVIKKNLIATCHLPEDKILLLHDGVDIGKFNPSKINRETVRKEFSITGKELLIGMLARFSPGKGHEEFLSTAKSLNKLYDNLKFMIVGEASRGESKYAESIKSIASEYGLNNIIFTGFRSDIPEVLAAMDIFVFPSHAEAFGIALVEAMAMGKPSVCAKADGVLDIALEDITSYFFKKQNVADLTHKLKLLIESSLQREKFGNAAGRRAAQFFDINVLTGKVIEIYETALKRN